MSIMFASLAQIQFTVTVYKYVFGGVNTQLWQFQFTNNSTAVKQWDFSLSGLAQMVPGNSYVVRLEGAPAGGQDGNLEGVWFH
jgi:hypothetical protein